MTRVINKHMTAVPNFAQHYTTNFEFSVDAVAERLQVEDTGALLKYSKQRVGGSPKAYAKQYRW
jgi:hypothetical protein